MKAVSFLDVICCALLSGVIVFKLQSGLGIERFVQGAAAMIALEVINPQKPGAEIEEIGLRVTTSYRGRTRVLQEYERRAYGRSGPRRLGSDTVIRDPVTRRRDGGDPTRFEFHLSFPGRKGEIVTVEITLPGHPEDMVTLAKELRTSGLDVALDTIGDAQLRYCRESNLAAIQIFEGKNPWVASKPGASRAELETIWLAQNSQALEWDFETFASKRFQERDPEGVRRLAAKIARSEDVRRWWKILFQLVSKAATKRDASRNARAQVIALNIALHSYFASRIEDPERTMPRLDSGGLVDLLPEGKVVPNESCSVEELFRQLALYLGAVPGVSDLPAEVLALPTDGASPKTWVTGASGVRYATTLNELVSRLREASASGDLFDPPSAVPRRVAMLHGPLFYQWARWQCLRCHVNAHLVVNGKKVWVDLSDLSPEPAEEPGWVRYRVPVRVPER